MASAKKKGDTQICLCLSNKNAYTYNMPWIQADTQTESKISTIRQIEKIR